jgi:hypothetical protein
VRGISAEDEGAGVGDAVEEVSAEQPVLAASISMLAKAITQNSAVRRWHDIVRLIIRPPWPSRLSNASRISCERSAPRVQKTCGASA